ncbi:hypothetical protein ScPMuIL_008283 [Solemya velum]
MEVVSVLMPLLENQTLFVPGHGDNIKAAPDFCMFATRRLIGGVSAWPKQQTSCSLLLDKMWMLVNIELLSETELKQVICTKYPQLSTIIEKILDVYFMLSSRQHEMTQDRNADEENAGRFLSHTRRLFSTRQNTFALNISHRYSSHQKVFVSVKYPCL